MTRSSYARIRVTPDELAALTAEARAAGLSLSDWLRRAVIPDPQPACKPGPKPRVRE